MKASVIIPNWNGRQHMEPCLSALAAQTHPDREVIVVDNASSDGSQPYIRKNWPDVRLIELSENRGFTGACNAGLEAAGGECLVLLNNDTEVTPTWLAALADGMESHPEAGILASKILLFDQRDTFHAAGDLYRADGRPVNRGVWEKDVGQYDEDEHVFGACGAAAAYRRAMLDQIGTLDDSFFFSCEDVDLAWRAQLTGWKCLYKADAVLYHRLAATGGGTTASYYDGRNTLWVIAKNYPGALWRKYRGAILQQQWAVAREALGAWRGKAARAKLRGMLAGLIALPRIIRGPRRQIQAARTVSTAYIESILSTAAP
jgi:GT2 family glycosyltransferase